MFLAPFEPRAALMGIMFSELNPGFLTEPVPEAPDASARRVFLSLCTELAEERRRPVCAPLPVFAAGFEPAGALWFPGGALGPHAGVVPFWVRAPPAEAMGLAGSPAR